jgi:hypothetical protein
MPIIKCMFFSLRYHTHMSMIVVQKSFTNVNQVKGSGKSGGVY